MQILFRPRRAGRTTEAVRYIKAHTDTALIVHSSDEKRRLIREYALPKERVWTASEFFGPKTNGISTIKNYIIDNIELVLPRLVRCPWVALGFTCEETNTAFLEQDEWCRRKRETEERMMTDPAFRQTYLSQFIPN